MQFQDNQASYQRQQKTDVKVVQEYFVRPDQKAIQGRVSDSQGNINFGPQAQVIEQVEGQKIPAQP